MPAEILHLIADNLWKEETHANWYDGLKRPQLKVVHSTSAQKRKDLLHMAACSKGLRTVLFPYLLRSGVKAMLDEGELANLAALSLDARSHIRYVHKVGGGAACQLTS
jgi:hypothetical protein